MKSAKIRDFCLDEVEQKIKLYFEKERKEESKKIKTSKVILTITLILILVSFSLLMLQTGLIKPGKLTSLVITQQPISYEDKLNLQFNASGEYEWQPEHYGKLASVKVSGKIIIQEQGSVKIYLEDALILDSSQLKKQTKKSGSITGFAIENGENTSIEESASIENIVPEDVSEENATEESEKNATENATEEKIAENATLYEIDFSNVCVDTCDLKKLNLEDQSYTIRIEIQEASLQLETISYSIFPTESKNRAPKLKKEIPDQEILVNSSFMLNLSEYFSDPDGDALVFYYKVLENENLTNITINEDVFFVSAYDVGYEKLIVSASDGNSSVDSNPFTIKVVNVTNNPPILLNPIPNITILKNSNISLDLNSYFKDPDDDFLTFSSTQPENISVIIKGSYVALVPEKDFVGNKTLKFYASDGNFTVESNEIFVSVVEINFTCFFDEPRKEDIKLPGKWFLKEKNSLGLKDDEHSKKVKNTVNLVQVECGNALLYNLSHVAETKDNIGISSVFDVEEGKYRISFFTKPEMILKNNKNNGFSIIIDVLDKNDREIETFPPLEWNADEIWELDETQKQKRNFTLQEGPWKKITIELEFPENSAKALIGFRSEGVGDYLGYVLITNFSLEKIS
ncbi:MAG: hypothetical protein QXI41_02495 [Candidatus Pacearchaeota archaeon]